MKFRESTFTVYFPLHFDGITSPSPKEMGDRPKAAIIREKVIRNVKWQMLCIWLVLMLKTFT
jgi:hypothetical protein